VSAPTQTRPDGTAAGHAPVSAEVRDAMQDLERLTPAPRARPAPAAPRPEPRLLVPALRALALVVLVGGWEVAARTGVVDPFFYSMPSQIWATGVTAVTEGTVLLDTAYTFSATLLGFVIGTVAGVAVGLSFWWSRRYAAVAEPFVVAFEAMPKLALAPIVVLVLGIGISSKVAMATALVVVVQALNTYSGVKSVDPDLTRMLASVGASRRQVFAKVVVPTTLPWVVSGLRVTIGLALSGAIVGEYIGATQGIGRMIQYAGSTYEISLIWVGIAVLAALSMVLYAVVGAVERRFLASLHVSR